jgi:hypothetical protein
MPVLLELGSPFAPLQHHRYVLSPSAGPQATKPDPEDAVAAADARTGVCPEGDVKLMAKREVLEGEVTVRSPQGQ